jgi:hypothetical protein
MKKVVPVEVTTCVLCKRTSYVADFLPEPEVTIREVTVATDEMPPRTLTLCEDDMAPFQTLFALAAEQGLPPNSEPTQAPTRQRARGGACEYCGRKVKNLLSHKVEVHPDKAEDHCGMDDEKQPGRTCGYPFYTTRSKNRHLLMTHNVEVKR